MTPYEVPLSPEPQTFIIALAGVNYRLTTSWCGPAGHWILDIAQTGGEPIVAGIPLVTGVDLLKQYEYLGLGGKLFVQSAGDATAIPNFEGLGVASKLYFVTEP